MLSRITLRCTQAVAGVCLLIALGCQPSDTPTFAPIVIDYMPAGCGSSTIGPDLAAHLTEADIDYRARVVGLDVSELPGRYDLSQLGELDRSLIQYMLDRKDIDVLVTEDIASLGLIGKAILLALGTEGTPQFTDYSELRRGLYHYYNCSRAHPARLDDFRLIYGDYRTWPSTMIEDSHPKIYPRRIRNNDSLGVYVAETLRDGEVHETEILLRGYRNDNALEFLTYLPNGQLTNRGEFRSGRGVVVGASPYACMSCHLNTETNEFTVVFPDINFGGNRP